MMDNLQNFKNNSYENYIDSNSVIDGDVKIFPNVYILGKSVINKGSIIYPGSVIVDSVIGGNCEIKSSYIENSELKNNVKVGPFAHIRPNSKIYENCKIGNFVEIKNAVLRSGTKAGHLAYIGDCEIGERCNIGCGVIFANYDGKAKHKTIIGNNCFIGSNSNIISPVCIGDNVYVCAGTTVTKNISSGDFVIGRVREEIKPNKALKYLKED